MDRTGFGPLLGFHCCHVRMTKRRIDEVVFEGDWETAVVGVTRARLALRVRDNVTGPMSG